MRALLILLAFIFLAGPVTAADVTILCYHTFLGKRSVYTDFSIEEFKSHIQILRDKGYHFVQWKDVITNKIKGTNNILLMIDDGHRTTSEAYYQVLKPHGIKPVLAIYPGITNSRSFALKWATILDLEKDGCEVMSHGYFHEFFTEKFYTQHPDRFNDEFFKSKKILDARLKTPVTAIVYPFGMSSDIAKQTLVKAGYKYGFSLRQAPLTTPVKASEFLDLPRYMMTRSNAKGILQRLTG
jgi:peptidoglycan/xylan/chitin deacetylase (PgdA/CDA1 family)